MRTFNSYDECRVLIHDRFSAYITWEEFEKNQQTLSENSRLGKLLAAPRHGPSVLSGLVVCGRCDRHLLVGYANTSAQKTLRYTCQREAIDYGGEVCQSLSGEALESFVVERLLQAVSPASLELSLSATAEIERERKQLDDHWQQRLARSRYEVEQARRQYAAVDPEHRLVARELERRWDEAIRAEEQLQTDYERFQRDCPTQLSASEREAILTLSQDLPALWHAESTTPEDRQMIVRLLLEQVTVTVEGNTDRVDVELRWAGGFVSRGTLISSRSDVRAVVELRGTQSPHRCASCRRQDVVRDRCNLERGRLPSAEANAAIHESDLESLPARTRSAHRRLTSQCHLRRAPGSERMVAGGSGYKTCHADRDAPSLAACRLGHLAQGDGGGRSLGHLRRRRRTRSPPPPPRLAARVASALPGRTHHSETKSRGKKNDMTVPLQELGENSTFGKMPSAPCHGPSVLSGLVVCCLSDHRMLVGYSNTSAAQDAAVRLPTGSDRLRRRCLSKSVGGGVGVVRRRPVVAGGLCGVDRVESGGHGRYRTRAKATRRSLAAASGAFA